MLKLYALPDKMLRQRNVTTSLVTRLINAANRKIALERVMRK